MTKAETVLWQELRSKKLGVKFLRQHPIYVLTEDSWQFRFVIADFYCDSCKLIIELDGLVHDTPEVEELDLYKADLLSQHWYTILRFQNDEIIQNLQQSLKLIKTIAPCSPPLYA